jgi:hypothetical protein
MAWACAPSPRPSRPENQRQRSIEAAPSEIGSLQIKNRYDAGTRPGAVDGRPIDSRALGSRQVDIRALGRSRKEAD